MIFGSPYQSEIFGHITNHMMRMNHALDGFAAIMMNAIFIQDDENALTELYYPLDFVVISDVISCHYNDVMLSVMASQIPRFAIVYSTGYSGADKRKHQSSASLAFVWGIHRWPMISPQKWPVMRKMFPLDDIIMYRLPYVGTWNGWWLHLQV